VGALNLHRDRAIHDRVLKQALREKAAENVALSLESSTCSVYSNPMTLRKSSLKHEVGVRELHDQLSRYVHHAAQGGEVVVTMHGRRVARLSPVNEGDSLADLRARGLVREPARPKQPSARRQQLQSLEPVSDLVAEQQR
jgi:prevent-host-death family protein